MFFGKNQKISNFGKIRKHDEGVFFRKKVLIFLKAFFTKMGRRKICRGLPAVFFSIDWTDKQKRCNFSYNINCCVWCTYRLHLPVSRLGTHCLHLPSPKLCSWICQCMTQECRLCNFWKARAKIKRTNTESKLHEAKTGIHEKQH